MLMSWQAIKRRLTPPALTTTCSKITALLGKMEAAAFGLAVAAGAVALRMIHTRRVRDEVAAAQKVDHLLSRRSEVVPVIGTPTKEIELFPVLELRDLNVGEIVTIPSPIKNRQWPRNHNFIGPGELTLSKQVRGGGRPGPKRAAHLFRLQAFRTASAESCARPRAFPTAGPSEEIAWDPATTRAAIVTSGKVCPGVNTIIRELFNCLTYVYGVPSGNIFGVRNGFCGFREPLVPLTSEVISKVGEAGSPLRVGCAPALSALPLSSCYRPAADPQARGEHPGHDAGRL